MGFFKRRAKYDLTVTVTVDNAANTAEYWERLEQAVAEGQPPGVNFENHQFEDIESAEGDILIDGRWESRGRIDDPEAAVEAWRRSIEAIEGIQEVVRVVLGGTDRTYAERFSQQTLDAYDRLDDETRTALGPRLFEKDAPP